MKWLLCALLASGCATVVPLNSPALHFTGPVDLRDPAGPRFAWSGTALTLRFTGTRVKAVFKELRKNPKEPANWPNRYRIELDGVVTEVLAGAEALAFERDGLPEGEHRLMVYRLTEPLVGVSQLTRVELDSNGAVLPPEPQKERHLLVIGDSVSTAFGIDGANEQCDFSSATQNHWDSYQAIAARALNAELWTLAWSGRGLSRNYDDRPEDLTLPFLWTRALPDDPSSVWKEPREPDAVLVLLGGNDFAHGDPGPAFVSAYKELLRSLRARFPTAQLFAGLDAGFRDDFPKNVKARTVGSAYVRQVVSEAGEARVHALEFSPRLLPEDGMGCLYHPSRKTHARMAGELEAVLRRELSW